MRAPKMNAHWGDSLADHATCALYVIEPSVCSCPGIHFVDKRLRPIYSLGYYRQTLGDGLAAYPFKNCLLR